MEADSSYENIYVEKIYSDSSGSVFIIWIRQGIALHYHAEHTEQVIVLQGTGLMQLNDERVLN